MLIMLYLIYESLYGFPTFDWGFTLLLSLLSFTTSITIYAFITAILDLEIDSLNALGNAVLLVMCLDLAIPYAVHSCVIFMFTCDFEELIENNRKKKQNNKINNTLSISTENSYSMDKQFLDEENDL